MSRQSRTVADTTPEALRVQFAVLRKLGDEGRLRQGLELSEQVRSTLESGIRMRHPKRSPEEIRLATIRVMLGDRLFRAAFPGVGIEF